MKDKTLQLNREQARLLAEIGAYLRCLRQDQTLSLEAIAATTLIPVRTLMAIEEGNAIQLPEPVYVQGFIRRYADAIGADGTEIANAFPAQSDLRSPKPTWSSTVEAQLRPLHLYLVYMLLVAGAVSGLSYVLNRSSAQAFRYANLPQQPGTGQLPTQKVELYGPPSPSQKATGGAAGKVADKTATPSPAVISDKPVRIGLALKAQSWIRIVADGKMEFEGVLSEGAQQTWAAKQQITVRAGNAGGVLVSYNESPPKLLGEPGTVEEKTFEAQSQAEANLSERPIVTASNLPGL
ncbi:helix-turn-helix domain-containing protein [Phormidium sp. CLA17]|uniref:helix-turn-helix domain-containing protein n=1 Tax=Leptolyngbya sp. Cla-17 TaxID=2803751 RepID=UPI001492DDAB|nr:RodZ domain-containing protein [Leptolyngbya sp. Cla-17]MBM0742607.1 helix-turn-helix domain-containing protein [Leptolyngbya sp. Cla-17]